MRAQGEALFPGTRVPIQTLLDWLEQGETVAEFLRFFPSVTREQALAALGEAGALAGPPRRATPGPASIT